MSVASTCKECGTAIPADSPGGWCPHCLLGLGLEEARSPGEQEVWKQSAGRGREVEKEKIPAAELSARFPTPLTEEPGDRIGRYRLLKEIGHGGCGVVYMAEQDEPVRRRVALKVIKLGMDTRQVVVRFEAERQALALMDHPNISKVLDAGATVTGRPYFVMELVSGIRITDYCNQSDFTIRQRLDLFTQVCRAIQHAHQKGVIHRDIKPSNVLVTTQDGVPVPKVIDFGIAKATEGRLADQTVFTAVEQFMGTPAYMSPEQARFGGIDLDTRSDIYSLGVLLYELLTGGPPFDPKELIASGLDEMRRTIQDKEPPPPSIRLKQELATDETGGPKPRRNQLTKAKIQIPSLRFQQMKQEIQLLRGDLDWIVMKCLEKDRSRRYETANGLSQDIGRYLNNEPIMARPPSRLYSFRKAVERNRTAFVSAVIVAIVLVLGIVGSTWQAVRATKAERRENHSLRQAKTAQANEARERKKAETALAQMQSIEINRAEEYYQAEDPRNMLPYLALVLRQNPENRLAAERLMSALSHRTWARLACPPLLHYNRLTWAMFDKSGTRVLTSSADKTAWVWDAASGLPVAGPLVHKDEINNADFSADGRFVITASKDKSARIWDCRTGFPVTPPLLHSENVSLAKFSPTGHLALTVSGTQTILWNAESGERSQVLEGGSPIEDACFNPDGSKVAVACFDGRVLVWGIASNVCSHTFEHTKRAKSVSFSPDGRWLVSGSYDKSARVWDIESGQGVGEPLLHDAIVLSAEFSPDGQRIITASSDHTAQIWETGTWKKLGPALPHSLDVRSALFSPEGMRVITTANQTARVWDAFSGAPLTELMAHQSGAYYGQFHPDGARVLTVSNGKAALIWEIIGTPSLALFFSNVVESVDFSPDGRAFVTASGGAQTRLWDSWTGKALTTPLCDMDNEHISRAIFNFDGKLVATAAPDTGTARIWNSSDGKPATGNLKHGIGLSHICFSPNGSYLLTSSPHRTCLWEVATGRLLHPFEVGSLPDAPSFSADGEMFFVLPEPRVAQVFSTRTSELLSPPLKHAAEITSAMFSPDGQSLLTTGGGTSFVIWDIKSGRRLGINFQPREPPFSASYSFDGKRVLTVTEKYRAQVWDLETAVSLAGEFGGKIYARNGLLSADGVRVLLTSIDGKAQLWDSASGSRLSEALPNGRNPVCTRMSADGRLLAVCSTNEKKVTIWEVPPADLPVPDWLPELAEALAGQHFNSQGVLEFVPPQELWAMQQKVAILAKAIPARSYTRWAKWFVGDASTRTVLPSSSMTLPQYAQVLLEQGTPQSWRQALLLQPTNALAMARVGAGITNLGLADWMTRRAVESEPERYETWIERASVLSKAGKVDEANQAMDRARDLKAKHN